jgi:hypothetical protein
MPLALHIKKVATDCRLELHDRRTELRAPGSARIDRCDDSEPLFNCLRAIQAKILPIAGADDLHYLWESTFDPNGDRYGGQPKRVDGHSHAHGARITAASLTGGHAAWAATWAGKNAVAGQRPVATQRPEPADAQARTVRQLASRIHGADNMLVDIGANR